jgi:hypothetical protein
MLMKKYRSAYYDFRTGFLYKISLTIGFFLLFIYIFLKVSSLFLSENSSGFFNSIYYVSQSNYSGSIIALSILFLSIGIILYFFHRQFSKLAKIAKEIENESEIKDFN